MSLQQLKKPGTARGALEQLTRGEVIQKYGFAEARLRFALREGEQTALAAVPPRGPESFERKLDFLFGQLRGTSTGKSAALALIDAFERRVGATADATAALLLEGGTIACAALEQMATRMLSAQNAARLARNLLDKYGLTRRLPESVG